MDFEKRIKEMLRNFTDALQTKVKDVHLISAKTGINYSGFTAPCFQ